MTDIWRDVVGWEGLYEISDKGVVKSLPRQVVHYTGRILLRKPRILRGCEQHGYVKVTLCKDGKYSAHRVHALVAAAFLGPRPEGKIVCHNDGNRKNNRVGNLRYDSHQGNSDDMARHGTVLRGERHGASKLTESDVREIRASRGRMTHKQLAAKFNVSVSQIGNVLYGVCWGAA